MNVKLTIYEVHTAPQIAPDCGQGLGGLHRVYEPSMYIC